MARHGKPWRRKGRGWYVQINGKQHSLGRDNAEAYLLYHQLMQAGPVRESQQPLVTVCDEFLDWNQKHRSEETYLWYQRKLQSFISATLASRTAGTPMDAIRPLDVHAWLALHPGWGSTSRRNAMTAVQRLFNWAVRMGYLDRSPLIGMEKPAANARDSVIAPSEYAAMLKVIGDHPFRDVVVTAWETGCRPQEVTRVEGRHFDAANSRWVFPPAEAKGKRKPRIVYLTETALAITQRLALATPEGQLFRNQNGAAWTAYSVNCWFTRLKVKLGSRYCLYLFRHSFATRMLESGIDALTVALLLGHSNPAMLSTTYQHLGHNPGHLLSQVRRGSAPKASDGEAEERASA